MANHQIATYHQKAFAYIAARKFIAAVFTVLLCHVSSGYALDGRLTQEEAYPDRVVERADGSLKFKLIKGDFVNNGARAMVREKLPSTLKLGEWQYYNFSINLAQGWPIAKQQDALVMQWRNAFGGPYMSLHLIGDQFYIKKAADPIKMWFVTANTTAPNKFQIRAKWAKDAQGEFIMSMNGKLVVQHKGQNLYSQHASYSLHGEPHVAFGIYRPQWNDVPALPEESMSLVFDYFKFGKIEDLPPGC
jgi:Polysaccharide lyase